MKVFKYNLDGIRLQTLLLPLRSEILHVDEQNGTLCLWAKVDDMQLLTEPRKIAIVGTGHSLINTNLKHINTIQVDSMVFHFFEVLE